MTLLCTLDDVKARPQMVSLADSLDSADEEIIAGWIEEASVLVEGYLEHTYPDPPTDSTEPNPDPVPDAARIVTARVVARAYTTPAGPATGQDSSNSTMGPFSKSAHITQDALGGGVWLTNQDKLALDSIPGRGLTNMALYEPRRYPVGSINMLHGPTGRPYGDWWY